MSRRCSFETHRLAPHHSADYGKLGMAISIVVLLRHNEQKQRQTHDYKSQRECEAGPDRDALTVIQPSKRKAPGYAAERDLRCSEIRTARPNSSFCLGTAIEWASSRPASAVHDEIKRPVKHRSSPYHCPLRRSIGHCLCLPPFSMG